MFTVDVKQDYNNNNSFYAPNFEEVEVAYCFIYPYNHSFVMLHNSWRVYASVLKFHIWVACEPLADLYFYAPAMKWGGACSFILACTYICPSHFVELYFTQQIKCSLKQYIEQLCTPEFCVQCHGHSCCFRKKLVMVLVLFNGHISKTSHKYDNIWNKCVFQHWRRMVKFTDANFGKSLSWF